MSNQEKRKQEQQMRDNKKRVRKDPLFDLTMVKSVLSLMNSQQSQFGHFRVA